VGSITRSRRPGNDKKCALYMGMGNHDQADMERTWRVLYKACGSITCRQDDVPRHNSADGSRIWDLSGAGVKLCLALDRIPACILTIGHKCVGKMLIELLCDAQ